MKSLQMIVWLESVLRGLHWRILAISKNKMFDIKSLIKKNTRYHKPFLLSFSFVYFVVTIPHPKEVHPYVCFLLFEYTPHNRSTRWRAIELLHYHNRPKKSMMRFYQRICFQKFTSPKIAQSRCRRRIHTSIIDCSSLSQLFATIQIDHKRFIRKERKRFKKNH